jgi:hypothetical protein
VCELIRKKLAVFALDKIRLLIGDLLRVGLIAFIALSYHIQYFTNSPSNRCVANFCHEHGKKWIKHNMLGGVKVKAIPGGAR